MSGDAEQEYFTDGITEDIITELSRFSLALCHRAQQHLHLQGPGGGCAHGRQGTGRSIRSRGQRQAGGQPCSRDRAVD
jgi:hypothetical protein